MALSTSLVLYTPTPSSTQISTRQSLTLIPSHLFAPQTGTLIATELIYRILIDILNRLLSSVQHLAARSMSEASTWMQRKLLERRTRLDDNVSSTESGGIMKEVDRMREERGGSKCPLTGKKAVQGQGRPMGPPEWVKGVLRGIDEGRMGERDFWIQTHGE